MNRVEMLEILYEQQKRIEELEEENSRLKADLDKKTVILKESGSIANASLALTNVFEEAQKAADIYLQSIIEIYKKADVYLNNVKEIYENAKKGKTVEDLDFTKQTADGTEGRQNK